MQKLTGTTICCLFLSLLALDVAHAAKVVLPRTGQTTCYDTTTNLATACSNTSGQDGNKLKGVVWPIPRFTNNGDGTVTDKLTGLIWLMNTNCSATLGGVANTGTGLTWANALTWVNNLASGSCNLIDASTAGQWRLPNRYELESLLDLSNAGPVLQTGHPFTYLHAFYWSSSASAFDTSQAWGVNMFDGSVGYHPQTDVYYVWPVRAGQ